MRVLDFFADLKGSSRLVGSFSRYAAAFASELAQNMAEYNRQGWPEG